MAGSLLRKARLARWLGPWANERARPAVIREQVAIPRPLGAPLKTFLYRPRGRRPAGAYLLIQGLHYDGPEDPRMDRFARVLANAGHQVIAPCIPAYRELKLSPTAIDDARIAARWALRHPDVPPGERLSVFTISFGSLLGLAIAGDPAMADRVGRLILFGGYRDWATTMRFAVTGCVDGERLGHYDPLNVPVVFLQALSVLELDSPLADDEQSALRSAWSRYVKATWGRVEMKDPERFRPLAEEMASLVPERLRTLFLQGCNVRGGTESLLDAALQKIDLDFLDPAPFLDGVRAPTHIVHGADDDVIPFTEAEKLRTSLSPYTTVEAHLTGLYGHSGTDSSVLLDNLGQTVTEIRTMARILAVMAG